MLIIFVPMNSTDINRSLGGLVSDVARLFRKRFDQRAKDLGLRPTQYYLLGKLSRNEGINQVGLASCVGNRAIVKQQQGDLTGALACVDEQLLLSQAIGNAQGVLFATANRGELLGQLGRKEEALAALGQARQMAAQYNLAPMVQQLDQMIAAVNASQN